MKVVLVPGTHAWKDTPDQWWHPESRFVANLATKDVQLASVTDPYVWSTDVNGFFDRGHGDWRAAAAALRSYIVPPLCETARIPGAQTNIIAHSHGGQVALYAAAAGLKIDLLVTVATPVRSDMAKVIEAARPNIRVWRHLHSGWRDYMQIFGEIGDGRFGLYRSFAGAENLSVAAAGHSGFLNDPRYARLWSPAYWLDDTYMDEPDRQALTQIAERLSKEAA